MKKAIIIAIFTIIIVFSTLILNTNVKATKEETILFIGNSKTRYNNLPEKVYNIAESDGSSELSDLNYAAVIQGGESLNGFYQERETYKTTLLSNKWDYVVLQERRKETVLDDKIDDFKNGASNLIQYLKQNNVIDENTTIIYNAAFIQGKESAESTNFYSVSELKAEQDKADKHYRIVKDYVEKQTNIKGRIAYSGQSFISAIEELNMEVDTLYLDEENYAAIHPTNVGTYLTACTIYETIFQSQVKDFSNKGKMNLYDNILDNIYDGAVSYLMEGGTSSGVKSAVNEDLREKCQYIARKYVDITSPVISSVTVSNSNWTNKPITIKFKATDNIYKVTVNGQELQSNNEEYSFSVSSNGQYNIEVVDLVGHVSTLTKNITNIDKTAPIANVSYSTTSSTNKNVLVTITANEEIQAVSGETLSTDKKVLTKEYEQNKTETIEITDIAGNKTPVEVKITNIDKTAPTADVSFSSTSPTNKNVKVTITANEEIQAVSGWTLSTDKKSLTKEYAENKTEIITIKDVAGNENPVEIKITNIDKIAPTATVSYSTISSTNKNVLVTITANEEIQAVSGWALSTDKKAATKEYAQSITEEITIKDIAGNEAIVQIKIIGIIEFKEGTYQIDENYIIGIQPKTIYEDFIKNIETNSKYKITEDEKEITVKTLIKTGQKLTLDEKTFTLVVIGDTNGDGQANIKDILAINKHRLNKANIVDQYLLAGDINEDEKVDLKDILQINKYRLGKINNL